MSDLSFPGVDLETFGLDHLTPIIEIGVDLRDADLKQIASESWLVWDHLSEGIYDKLTQRIADGSASRGDQIVFEMHTKSGLWVAARSIGESIRKIAPEVQEYLFDHGLTRKHPMVGSSIGFDRRFLQTWAPALDESFSYRNIDVSTIKELMRVWAPRTFQRMESEAWGDRGDKQHRTLGDLDHTFAELAWYKENFFIIES